MILLELGPSLGATGSLESKKEARKTWQLCRTGRFPDDVVPMSCRCCCGIGTASASCRGIATSLQCLTSPPTVRFAVPTPGTAGPTLGTHSRGVRGARCTLAWALSARTQLPQDRQQNFHYHVTKCGAVWHITFTRGRPSVTCLTSSSQAQFSHNFRVAKACKISRSGSPTCTWLLLHFTLIIKVQFVYFVRATRPIAIGYAQITRTCAMRNCNMQYNT